MNIAEFQISLESILPEGLELPLDLAADRLQLLLEAEGHEPPPVVSPLRGRLRLQLIGRRLLLKGVFEVEVEIACDRCLNESRTILGGVIDETLDLTAPGQSPANDDDGGDLEVVDGKVDLSALMAEFFWLAWPFRFICREDCAGLCPRCGADLNQGPCGCREQSWN